MRQLRCSRSFSFLNSSVQKFRKMSTNSSTHIDRTESSFRQENISSAEVTEINQLSHSVKELKLKVFDKSFCFKPGQWVDFFIKELATVGGFSISSSPRELQNNGFLHLAIKHSDHPPAHWVHTKCKVGDKIKMRVGGDFYLDIPESSSRKEDLLLVAGGVGINPLWSMMQCISDVTKERQNTSFGSTVLLYSARSNGELIFKDEIIEVCNHHPLINCKFFVSEKTTEQKTFDTWTQGGRITNESLQDSLSQLDIDKLRVFICGPQTMIQSVLEALLSLGVNSNKIQFEKWW